MVPVVTVGVNAAGVAVEPVVVAMPGPDHVYDAVPMPPAGVAVSVSLLQMPPQKPKAED